MLTRQIQQIVNSNPDYAAIAPVIEKEILHHDTINLLLDDLKPHDVLP